MLLCVVLAVTLQGMSLALACSCPPAPAAPKVCGSDLETYDSQCHLECVPGVSPKHPGPCLAIERSQKAFDCFRDRQCKGATDCGCGARDYGCNEMCKVNCRCGCSGYPRAGMNSSLWVDCTENRCTEAIEQCEEGCNRKTECLTSCFMHYHECGCECLQKAYRASQRRLDWTACLERDQCHNMSCSECGGADPICDKRCAKRCQCKCAGYPRPRRDLLSGEWEECFHDGKRSCEEAHEACAKECRDQGCRDKCALDLLDCSCPCRSAIEAEWYAWLECKGKEKCKYKTCECLLGDTACLERCRRHCGCTCLGINADSLDAVSVQQCQADNGCQTTLQKCLRRCATLSDKDERKECEHSCKLALEKCYCECARSRPAKQVQIIQHCNFIS